MSENFVANIFSFHGRMSRGAFRRIVGLTVLGKIAFSKLLFAPYQNDLAATLTDGAMRLFGLPVAADGHATVPPATLALMGLVVALWSWILMAALVKRLHDFGWSGWLSLAPSGLLALGVVGGLISAMAHSPEFTRIVVIGGIGGGMIANVLLFGLCGFRNGSDGPNRHDAVAEPPARKIPEAAPALPRATTARTQVSKDIQLATYKPPHFRRAGFGRRGVA
jgi:uncharacterized membrane protein YhaH (DUF805 family)